MKLLSICIPTYNRGKYLIELLDSIAANIKEHEKELIQICISDNGSSDDTSHRIDIYKSTHPDIEIKFHINEKNLGPDGNFMQCVKLSDARYCWLMGDDDLVSNDGISAVLRNISLNAAEVYVANRIACNSLMMPMYKENWIKSKSNYLTHFCCKNEVVELFSKLTSTTALLGYMSVIVFLKSEWDSVKSYKDFIDSGYIHTYIILSFLLSHGGNIMYIHDYVTLSRFGNDSFRGSLGQRIMLDIYGYLNLSVVFSDDDLRRSFLTVLRRHYNDVFLWALHLSTPKLEKEALGAICKCGYSDRDISIFSQRSRLMSLLCLCLSILKLMIVDFKRFIRTVRIVSVRLFKY